jgi:anti-sigma B factor antagonist
VHISVDSSQHNVTVLYLTGDVDMQEVTTFRQTLKSAVEGAHRGVIVELTAVPFIDSSGIAVLIEGLKWSREKSHPFVLAHLSPAVRMVMELSHLEGVFTIAEDLDDAFTQIANAS